MRLSSMAADGWMARWGVGGGKRERGGSDTRVQLSIHSRPSLTLHIFSLVLEHRAHWYYIGDVPVCACVCAYSNK